MFLLKKITRLLYVQETYAYGTSKDLVSEKEDIKYNNTTKLYKNDCLMIL